MVYIKVYNIIHIKLGRNGIQNGKIFWTILQPSEEFPKNPSKRKDQTVGDWKISEKWFIQGSIAYDGRKIKVSKGQVARNLLST